jgi:glycosyltransferase involved in cell wall biosynthesis
LPGLALLRLNRDLIEAATAERPDCIWVWRGTHILPDTLRKLKRKTGAILVSYNNDDPFGPQVHGKGPWHHRYLWWHYLSSIPEYDLHFVYRAINVREILQAGGKQAHVLMPYFIPDMHRPVELSSEEETQYGCDVVFAGHYERDGREQYLRALAQAGLEVRLFGGGTWTRSVLGDLADYFGEIRPVSGDEYAKVLCGAKMCLCFLSRMNRDTYTRRCFEIPACGRLLLSERTDDLRRLFKEDEGAVYFSSPEELVEKALWLREHPEEIERIAHAGLRRVHADGHSVDNRMRQLLSQVDAGRKSSGKRPS